MNLKRFCSTDYAVWDLGEPFVQGGYRYGTDGWMAVRTPCGRPDTKNRKLPGMSLLGWRPRRVKWWPMPGEKELDAGKQEDGTVWLGANSRYGNYYRYDLLVRLCRLENAEFQARPSCEDKPLLIRFAGGDALLMPGRKRV